MNKLSSLRIAIDVLSDTDDLKDISFIAILNWSSVPEAYTHVKTIVLSGHRVSLYSLNSTQIIHIIGVGLFQIM
jgi:hypothetical protein